MLAIRTTLTTSAVALFVALSGPAVAQVAAGETVAGDQTVTRPEQGWQEFIAGALEDALRLRRANLDYASKRDDAALVEFYAERQHKPIWLDDGRLNQRARETIAFLDRVDIFGLDPRLYQTPSLELGADEPAPSTTLADAELQLSRSALAYARHAYSGRLNPASLSENLTNKPELPDPIQILQSLAGSNDIAGTLTAQNPQHPEFQALREKLAELRREAAAEGGGQPIPRGRTLKPGMSDVRVGALKKRLGIALPPPEEAIPAEIDRYDGEIVDAVMKYQEENGLKPDGIVGPATLAALNSSAYDKIARVIANMERWRWLPHDLGTFRVMVDIPGFMVNVYDGRKVVYSGRVVVGKPQNQTPIFSDEFEYIEVNPYWNVPRSIAANEIIPAVLEDPDYLRRGNYQVVAGDDNNRAVLLDPYSIDWYTVDPSNLPFRFRQPPGRGNALGNVKFMFPNKHDVYLHDTPARSLFSRDRRAYSHGCVRLHEPLAFAEALLTGDAQLTAGVVRKEISRGQNRALGLSRKVPVHLTYFTAYVDEAGKLQFHEDIYGHDQRVMAALGL